jgi:ABC-type dipeptide/oligopeptide/nickel transport system ATPase component
MPRVVSAARERGRRYEVIPGLLADLGSRVGAGCSFAPRCPERFAPCDANAPDLYPTGAGNSVARCFLYGGTDASTPAPGGRR